VAEDQVENGALRVLVACEYSGVVRDAFLALGHNAISCDLLPSDAPGPHHQGDVLPLLAEPWDLVIAHPPCTYLCKSGLRWLTDESPKYRLRWQEMIDGAAFFRACMEANAPRVAVENPSMHRWATKIVGRRYDQLVQPYMFGHTERKATGLWLKGLPPLVATEDVHAATVALPARERDRVHWAPPGADRWKARSTTYTGIAAAMAEQWGGHVREVAHA
jgi:hypothetical protein